MKLTIIGTGYVGLVTGTCLAETGNDVVCVDCDVEKIRRLCRGEIPIYEPGLTELVERNISGGRLTFTTDMAAAVGETRLVFLAVGTPPGEDGSADLRALWAAVDEMASHLPLGSRARCPWAPTLRSRPGWRRSPGVRSTWPAIQSSSRKGRPSRTS
jgi:UDPglucose 6-dehydrogenase